jgi:hypothetical protein
LLFQSVDDKSERMKRIRSRETLGRVRGRWPACFDKLATIRRLEPRIMRRGIFVDASQPQAIRGSASTASRGFASARLWAASPQLRRIKSACAIRGLDIRFFSLTFCAFQLYDGSVGIAASARSFLDFLSLAWMTIRLGTEGQDVASGVRWGLIPG